VSFSSNFLFSDSTTFVGLFNIINALLERVITLTSTYTSVFKDAYLSLFGMAPAYLQAADCQLVSDEGHRQLWSANSYKDILSSNGPATALETDVLLLQVLGCGSTNKLPAHLRQNRRRL